MNTLKFRKYIVLAGLGVVSWVSLGMLMLVSLSSARPVYAANTDLSNNLGETGVGNVGVTATNWWAQAFTTTVTNNLITSIELPICNATGTTGTYSIQIWSMDASHLPLTKIADVVANRDVITINCTSNPPSPVVFGGLSIPLSVSTSYYLVVREHPGADGFIIWEYTNSVNGTGFPSYRTSSTDAGATWSAANLTMPLQMRVVAAATTDLSNNLGETGVGNVGITATNWWAQAFTTTVTYNFIRSVELPICNATGTTGTYSIQIWSMDASHLPLTKVADVVANRDVSTLNCTSNPPSPVVFSGLSILLSASTPYYMLVREHPGADGFIIWEYTNSVNGTGFPSYRTFSTNAGVSWQPASLTTPLQIRVVADTPPTAVTLSSFHANAPAFDLAAWFAEILRRWR